MMCETEGGCRPRSFLTAEEKVENLKEYKDWLELEKKGVEEAIAKIKSK